MRNYHNMFETQTKFKEDWRMLKDVLKNEGSSKTFKDIKRQLKVIDMKIERNSKNIPEIKEHARINGK